MAAKGTQSKYVVFSKLKEVFPNSFWEEDGKILRVPLDENGTRVEIKVTLTAAKTNMGGNEPESAFGSVSTSVPTPSVEIPNMPTPIESTEPSQEEKENVAKLIASLGL